MTTTYMKAKRRASIEKLVDRMAARGPSRQLRGRDLIPLYAEIEPRAYKFIEGLAAQLHQTKAKTLTRLLVLLDEDRVFQNPQ